MTESMVWTVVASLTDIPCPGALRVEVDGEAVALVRQSDGQLFAIDDTCSHANVSLAEGDIGKGEIECWLHGSKFDLATGAAKNLPATEPVAIHHVRIDGDDVLVALANE